MDTNLSKKGFEEIKERAIEHLSNEPDCYGCDLHDEIYNQDYFIIGSYDAEQWLIKNYGIFNAIDRIKEYEQDNFGEVTTDLSESVFVTNMIVYILGEELLNESKTLQDCWNRQLEPKDCKKIIKELKAVKF